MTKPAICLSGCNGLIAPTCTYCGRATTLDKPGWQSHGWLVSSVCTVMLGWSRIPPLGTVEALTAFTVRFSHTFIIAAIVSLITFLRKHFFTFIAQSQPWLLAVVMQPSPKQKLLIKAPFCLLSWADKDCDLRTRLQSLTVETFHMKYSKEFFQEIW